MLNEKEFYQWFKENSPLCGKMATMKKICDAFPEASFDIKQPFPPFEFGKYSSEAAILMNKWKKEGVITIEKKGRVWCYMIEKNTSLKIKLDDPSDIKSFHDLNL